MVLYQKIFTAINVIDLLIISINIIFSLQFEEQRITTAFHFNVVEGLANQPYNHKDPQYRKPGIPHTSMEELQASAVISKSGKKNDEKVFFSL